MTPSKLLLLSLITSALALPVMAADISVTVRGVTAGEGSVVLALHNGAAGFPKDEQAVDGQIVSASASEVTVVFEDVPEGQYAVAAFQDLDSDDELSTNFVGMPTDPYGFSRDARAMFSAPAFADAAFDVGAEDVQVNFSVR